MARSGIRLAARAGLAAATLTGCGGARRIDYSVLTLVQSLKDPDPNMRYYAAKSLGKYGPEAAAAVPDLVGALKDESALVRSGAAYALGDLGPTAAAAKPALLQAAKDADKDVRTAVAYALKRLQGRTR
jgi:HEAT repeat protein